MLSQAIQTPEAPVQAAAAADPVAALARMQPPADMPFHVAKIGHVVLMVEDLARSVEFYTQVLGFKVTETYPDSMVAGGMVFLRFGGDHHALALIGSGEGRSHHREINHLAFALGSVDELFRARDHLERHGVRVLGEGRRRAGCQLSIDFRDPDGHSLELYWGIDQVDWNGAPRPASEWIQTRSLEEAVDRAPSGQDTTMAEPSLRRDRRVDA